MAKNIKEIHKQYIVCYKVGAFVNCYGKDAYIYFEERINYIIIDTRNNYEIDEKEEYKNLNTYNEILEKAQKKLK